MYCEQQISQFISNADHRHLPSSRRTLITDSRLGRSIDRTARKYVDFDSE